MNNGYIIELESKTFPGYPCYIALLGLNIKQKISPKWGRILEPKWAHIFARRSDAEETLAELLCKESFVAPEINGDLAIRLSDAKIIKIKIQK